MHSSHIPPVRCTMYRCEVVLQLSACGCLERGGRRLLIMDMLFFRPVRDVVMQRKKEGMLISFLDLRR